MSWPTLADDPAPLTTIVLVARGGLPDANFNGSTVLVMNNIAAAPFGIIVNRPTELSLSQLLPDLQSATHRDDKVYFGGPVDLGSVSFLFRADAPPEHAIEVVHGGYLGRDGDLLRTLLERETPKATVRVFIGYAGWEPDQLKSEIARGDWTVAPASPAAIFDTKPEHAWPETPVPEGRRI
jgi:putative transcriptional regulator